MANLKAMLLGGTLMTGMVAIATPALAQASDADDTGLASSSAIPAANAPADAPAMDANAIIVTARRRNESMQETPVAVSVVTPALIESKGTFSPVDLVASTPGLNVTASVADRNNVIYAIRGQSYAYGTIFPAVVTYFNEVPISQLSPGEFFDLSNVQVLRGPQGVNFGRVTDGGNVMLTPAAPTGEFEGAFGAKFGNYNSRVFSGMLNVPLLDDKIMVRGAFEVARRDGFTRNVTTGVDHDNVHYDSFRVSLKLAPTDNFENTTVANFYRSDDNGTATVFAGINPAALGGTIGQLVGGGGFPSLFTGIYGIDDAGNIVAAGPGVTPLTAETYLASQYEQLAQQQQLGIRQIASNARLFDKRKNMYIVNTTRVQLTDNIELKNVFGYVHQQDDQASNYGGANGAAVLTCHSACGYPGSDRYQFRDDEQFSEELRLSGESLAGRLNWSIGGYMDEQRGAGPARNETVNAAILRRIESGGTVTKSRAVYGSAEFAVTDSLKLNGGLRYTHDTVDSKRITYTTPIPLNPDGVAILTQNLAFLAEAGFLPFPPEAAPLVAAGTYYDVPDGDCVEVPGGILGPANCREFSDSFNVLTWTAGVSYEAGRNKLFYGKVSKGYRPGGVNASAPPDVPNNYQPETNISIELGAKADWYFGDAFLRTNVAVYRDRYKDIQKLVIFPSATPLSLVQNVNDGKIQGIEWESVFKPVPSLTLGFNAAYTDAKFDKQDYPAGTNPCDPTLPAIVGFCYKNLYNSTPKFQYTLRFGYESPFKEDFGRVGFSAEFYHQSKTALTDTSVLNPNAVEAPWGKVDANVSWTDFMGRPIDLGFFVTNLLDEEYRVGSNDLTQRSSLGIRSSIYAAPRMWGFSMKYRFGD